MTPIRATWTNGQVVLEGSADWPDGARLLVLAAPPVEVQFLTETEQADDPQSIQQWIDELRSIPPLPVTAEQQAESAAWRQQVRAFNLDAVRRQMEEGVP
jgi:hypothetical protein